MAENNSGQSGTQGSSQNNSSRQSGLSWSQPSSVAKPVQTGTPGTASAPKITPTLKPATSAAATAQGSSRRTFLLFAGGVVVGGLLAWSWFFLTPAETGSEEDVTPAAGEGAENAGAQDSGTNTGNPSALPGSTVGNEALVVPSPQDAGLSVMVTSTSVTSPTWVVVYESQNGVRGNALGAALFFPGGATKTINLLRATTPARTYFVGRHVDNGDKQFSLTNDKAVVNAAGNPVYVEFRTR